MSQWGERRASAPRSWYERSRITSVERKDRLQVAKVCLLILYLRLSFRGMEVKLPSLKTRDFAPIEKHRGWCPVAVEEEQITSLPPTSGEFQRQHLALASTKIYNGSDDSASSPWHGQLQNPSSDNASLLRPTQRDSEAVPTQNLTERLPPSVLDHIAIHAGDQFGNITISDHANVHLGTLYSTYNAVNTNLQPQYDTFRVGLVAGTTAAMMSQILSAALAYLRGQNPEKVPNSRTSEEDIIIRIGEQVSLAVGDSWIQEYRIVNSPLDEKLKLSVEIRSLGSLVPIIAVAEAKRRPMNEDYICEPLHEIIDLMSKRALFPPDFKSLRTLGKNAECLKILAESGICIMATEFLDCHDRCHIIHEFGKDRNVCCLVFRDDHFAPFDAFLPSTLIIFKSESAASRAMGKWRRDQSTGRAAMHLRKFTRDLDKNTICMRLGHLRSEPWRDPRLHNLFFSQCEDPKPNQDTSNQTENSVEVDVGGPKDPEKWCTGPKRRTRKVYYSLMSAERADGME